MSPRRSARKGRYKLPRTNPDRAGASTAVMVGDRHYRVWLASEHVEVKTAAGRWRKVSSRSIETRAILRASDAVNANPSASIPGAQFTPGGCV